jgi:hypothetical protein
MPLVALWNGKKRDLRYREEWPCENPNPWS